MSDIIIGSIAGLVSGIAGSMGLGGGSVLIIYLTLFAGVKQLAAQGTNLIFFVPIAAVSVFIYAKRGIIKWRTVLPIMAGGVIGTVGSGLAVSLIGGELLSKIFGGFIILYGLIMLFSKNKSPEKQG